MLEIRNLGNERADAYSILHTVIAAAVSNGLSVLKTARHQGACMTFAIRILLILHWRSPNFRPEISEAPD
jgi:hypothetical protein